MISKVGGDGDASHESHGACAYADPVFINITSDNLHDRNQTFTCILSIFSAYTFLHKQPTDSLPGPLKLSETNGSVKCLWPVVT